MTVTRCARWGDPIGSGTPAGREEPPCASECPERPDRVRRGSRRPPRPWSRSARSGTTCSSSRAPARCRASTTPPTVRAGADVVDEAVWNADVLLQDQRARPTPRSRCCARARSWCRLLAPALNPDLVAGPRRPRGHRAGDGRRAAHLARPVAGRAVVDGQHRWLPGGGRGGPRVRLVLHRPGHRGGQGAAGQGARRRRRRGRPGRDRHGEHRWARSCGPSTRAPRSASRSSRWGRSSCASTSRRPGRRPTGYAKEMSADFDRQGRRAVRRAGRRRRHRHHHGADPGPAGAAADHRGDGRLDEARLGRRRHGRGQRRQRRRQRSPTSGWSPTTA